MRKGQWVVVARWILSVFCRVVESIEELEITLTSPMCLPVTGFTDPPGLVSFDFCGRFRAKIGRDIA